MVPDVSKKELEKMARHYLYAWVVCLFVFVIALIIDGLGADLLAMIMFVGGGFIAALFGSVLTALYPKGTK